MLFIPPTHRIVKMLTPERPFSDKCDWLLYVSMGGASELPPPLRAPASQSSRCITPHRLPDRHTSRWKYTLDSFWFSLWIMKTLPLIFNLFNYISIMKIFIDFFNRSRVIIQVPIIYKRLEYLSLMWSCGDHTNGLRSPWWHTKIYRVELGLHW